jgi:hypothetical protein
VDLELRYHGEEHKLDVGVFAPTEILSVEEAEAMVGDFLGFFA